MRVQRGRMLFLPLVTVKPHASVFVRHEEYEWTNLKTREDLYQAFFSCNFSYTNDHGPLSLIYGIQHENMVSLAF